MFKFLSEFGPLVAFFVAYKYGNIQSAASYMLIASVISIGLYYLVERKIQAFSLVSSGVLLLSASVTIISGNPIFIKIKPTILYIVFGLWFLISAKRGAPLLKYLLNELIEMDAKSWNILSYRFAFFFLTMAVVNEIVWRNFHEAAWVNFKVFWVLPLTGFFILLQAPFVLKRKIPKQ